MGFYLPDRKKMQKNADNIFTINAKPGAKAVMLKCPGICDFCVK